MEPLCKLERATARVRREGETREIASTLHQPGYTREGMLGNRAVLLAIVICLKLQLLFTYAPFMNLLFGTEPLDAEAWLRYIAVSLLVFVAVELEKFALRRRIADSERGDR